MVIDERNRHELYQRLGQTIGEEATATLMSYLPPVGWADVATKADLLNLEDRYSNALLAVKHEVLAELHRELNAMTRTVVLSVIGTNVSIAGGALALSRLL